MSHYDQSGFSVWDIIKAYCPKSFSSYEGYLWGNIVKYLLRCGFKHETPDSDLEKAWNYLQRLLSLRDNATPETEADKLHKKEQLWREWYHNYRKQLQCQKKSNDPAPDAGVEAGTTKEKVSGSASTVTTAETCEDLAALSLHYCQQLKRQKQWLDSELFYWLEEHLK